MGNQLSQVPVSFDELLDLFDAYVATIGAPLLKATHLIQDELGYREGDIFEHIVGVVDDADVMAKRLRHIRAVRKDQEPVTLTLTEAELDRYKAALEEVPYLIGHARFICNMAADELNDTRTSDPGLASLLDMAGKGFKAAEGNEAEAAAMLGNRLGAIKAGILNRRRDAEIAAQTVSALRGVPIDPAAKGDSHDDQS